MTCHIKCNSEIELINHKHSEEFQVYSYKLKLRKSCRIHRQRIVKEKEKYWKILRVFKVFGKSRGTVAGSSRERQSSRDSRREVESLHSVTSYALDPCWTVAGAMCLAGLLRERLETTQGEAESLYIAKQNSQDPRWIVVGATNVARSSRERVAQICKDGICAF